MAIMGFLVHAAPGEGSAVEAGVAALPGMTTYGIHQDCYVVAVLEAPRDDLERAMDRVRGLESVLACYVTSLTVEDELDEAREPSENSAAMERAGSEKG